MIAMLEPITSDSEPMSQTHRVTGEQMINEHMKNENATNIERGMIGFDWLIDLTGDSGEVVVRGRFSRFVFRVIDH